jgi:hypothetical protein
MIESNLSPEVITDMEEFVTAVWVMVSCAKVKIRGI